MSVAARKTCSKSTTMSSAARTIIRALWLAAAVQGQIAGNSMTASDIARMLELHNQFRAMYSQPPLVWNTDLEADASLQTEAVNAQQVNARDCLGGNGFQPHGNLDSQLWKGQLIRVGQNEASGTLGAFQSIDSIFYAWASETPEILRNPLTTDHASQILVGGCLL
ncbi:hypothetical protein BC830DRAFT_946845 [Chytriomyces sp. MP71]|nr:hypothetical protein BC830DRAFT_946845 [Chytriomyces sp. MP71]